MSDSSEDFEFYKKITYNSRLYCSLVSIIFIILLFIFVFFSFLYNFFISKSKTSSKKSFCFFSIGTLGKIMIFFSIFCIFLKSLVSCIFSYEDISNNKNKCFIQGLIINISEISLICWNSNLNYFIYQFLFKNFNIKVNLILYLIYGFLPSFLLSFLPIIIKKDKYEIFGKSGAWCWIHFDEDKNNKFNSILIFITYFFEWINIIYTLYVINKIDKYLKHMINQSENSEILNKFLSFLMSFPIILFFIWIFPSINRIYSFITKKDNFTFYMGNGISMGLLGFFFSLNYFYFTYKKYFKCCFKENNIDKLNEEINEENNEEISS